MNRSKTFILDASREMAGMSGFYSDAVKRNIRMTTNAVEGASLVHEYLKQSGNSTSPAGSQSI
jgi:hypothetical protein